jgi:hypothetical protein
MRYPVLEQSDAKIILDARRTGEPSSVDDLIKWRGEGTDLDLAVVENIRKKLQDLKSGFPATLRARDPQGGRFEAEACCIVHQGIPWDSQMLSDFDFWSWVAVVAMPDIVEWRYGGESRHVALENYGIGKRDENLMFRLWMRAEIVSESSTGPRYDIARRGDIDLWRSHILRQRYANCRKVSRSLVRFQYPDESPESPRISIDAIRVLAKRLRRIRANRIFEILDEGSIFEMIERESRASAI